jgi:cellulose synthase/poly-beta-1,6-N-acetylglucosamine synthase-like glycosyltransferase/peptidoglycan/xylan/chitin deacetylase (PgdA/CDA1 family)
VKPGSTASDRFRAHWFALVAVMMTIAVALVLQGYAHSEVGHSSTRSSDTSAAMPDMSRVGPIIDLSGSSIRSITPRPKTIALTFDDGPDDRWTPRILSVLDRYHVPATFFVIGSHAADHGGMLRREVALGDEIGNHTFTHADVSKIPEWRTRLELRLTELSLAAAIGRHTSLWRPPYSSTPDAIDAAELRAWQKVAGQGYLIVLSTLNTEDWRRNASVADIVRRATPSGSRGAVVLMHDGGGDRARTVAALEQLIPSLQARGYRFVTVGDAARLSRDVVMPAASGIEQVQSKALPAALRTGEWLAETFTIFALVVGLLALARLAVALACARRHSRRLPGVDPTFVPAVSVLVPAFNEEAGIEASVRSLCTQDYPDFEVIVIDDGSTDATRAIVEGLIAEFGASRCSLVCQENAGKSNALNAGLGRARGEVIVTVDADTAFTPGALAKLVQPLRDERVGAVSGNTKVANRHRVLGRWQHLEYTMGFNLDRRMYDILGCMPTVPGAIGAFRLRALDDVGRFSDDTLAEDTDLTMALHRAGWTVAYEPRAVAFTEVPQGLRDLWHQRYRWSYGTMQSAWKHRRAFVEGGASRRLGWIGLPYLVVFQIVFPLLGPVVDLFAVYGLLFLNRRAVAAYWIGFTLIQLAVTVYALRLDRESLRDLWALPLQQFVYRQLMYLVVIHSLSTALSGARTGWHGHRRTGALNEPPEPPETPEPPAIVPAGSDRELEAILVNDP